MDGHGCLELSNGDVYRGQFKQGHYHDVGNLTKVSGDIYDGAWVGGMQYGHGRKVQIDGTVYEGSFELNQYHGVGALTSGNDGTTYRGNFVRGVMEGDFEIEYHDGRLEWRKYERGIKVAALPKLNFKGPVEYTLLNCEVPGSDDRSQDQP